MIMKLGVIEKDINSFICPNYGFLVSEAVQTFLKQIYYSGTWQLALQAYFFFLSCCWNY